MVLNLVDQRVVKNSKVEIYSGHYLDQEIEAIKVFVRATAIHAFKEKSIRYRIANQPVEFNNIKDVKLYIDRL